nr:response regulator transcription factor [Tardibacter chloracetimidivorans]
MAESETLSRSIDSSNPPDLIIVDGHSDNKNYHVCRDLHSQFPQSHIVLMADEFQVEDVANAFGAGVDGYLVKAISCEPLGSALRLVAHGEKVIPSQIVEALADPVWRNGARALDTGKLDLNLSDREIEILRCLVTGDANKIIARRLDITEATVKVHIKAILRKLRVMNRTQAAIWAVTRGLHQDEPVATASIHNLADQPRPLLRAAGA